MLVKRPWSQQMIRDLHLLSYGSDTELKDPARLKRLFRHAQFGNYLAVILPCLFFGVPILTGLGWLAFGMIVSANFRPFWYMEPILAGLGALVFFFVRAFAKEITLDPIPASLRAPSNFEFLPGAIESADYSAGERRSGDRMICHGHFKSARMENHPIIEIFRPGTWPFGQRVAQEQDRERPERQSFLPLAVIVLSEKVEPFRATVVGIRKADILQAETERKNRNKTS
jgi:hypothetical protein